ncbi:MAG: L-lactate MFS transporter [Candidatus Electronema sp. V4]|uniref:L-lactate MFS transporter n=1 Tax=Candidatus Electronema sp. V4 TaxID=3454756 RepID=UPI00405586B8
MAEQCAKEPRQAWITTFAGMAVNLCLGILYAWSMWSAALTHGKAGEPMSGLNEGWRYLSNTQAATPFSICMIMFALLMIPGGRIQDKISPRFGATLGGLLLAAGCIVAGLMQSYTGLIIGFGILGGMGMGIGYAAPTPAALKWFGPHRRGLIAGLVVGGYGGAALYISPLAEYLIGSYGISKSFIFLGIFFATVVVIAGQLLKTPNEIYPDGSYVPPAPKCARTAKVAGAATKHDWRAREMLRTWQFYALAFMFILTTQSGMLIIANAAGLLKTAGSQIAFFADNAWLIVAYGGLVNALGRVGTGFYSDKIGRANTYTMNCMVSAVCLLLVPYAMKTQNILLLFIVIGNAYWQYGGGLALMPLFTGDFYGSKNLGANYGLVFIGWGLGFFMAKLGGMIKDLTGSLDYAFYISAGLLVVGAMLAQVVKRPRWAEEQAAAFKA